MHKRMLFVPVHFYFNFIGSGTSASVNKTKQKQKKQNLWRGGGKGWEGSAAATFAGTFSSAPWGGDGGYNYPSYQEVLLSV